MKCACGSKSCDSELVWDKGSQAIIVKHRQESNTVREILLYYDANALITLSKEIKVALDEMMLR